MTAVPTATHCAFTQVSQDQMKMELSTQTLPRIVDEDLPAIYRAADAASLSSQKIYLKLLKIDLVALVAGAILTSFTLDALTIGRLFAVVGALLLFIGFVLTLVINQKNYKQRWYGGRAIAESVKTLSWRYMTCAEPFQSTLESREADDLLLKSLHDVLEQSENLYVALGGELGTQPQITDTMRRVRKGDVSKRKRIYLEYRIADQRKWYSSKSERNERSEGNLFKLVIFAQFLSLVGAVGLVGWPGATINPTGAFAAAAAAFLAWLQIKQHQELSQSYGVAAHELGLIVEQARYIEDDVAFSGFVADAEKAISREHTLWLARRDRLPGLSSQR